MGLRAMLEYRALLCCACLKKGNADNGVLGSHKVAEKVNKFLLYTKQLVLKRGIKEGLTKMG